MTPEALKTARLRLGLSQTRLGQALGLSYEYIGRMERGLKPIEPRTELAVKYLLRTKNPASQ